MNAEAQRLLKEVHERFPIGSDYTEGKGDILHRIISKIDIVEASESDEASVCVYVRSPRFATNTSGGCLCAKVWETRLPVAFVDLGHTLVEGESFDYSPWETMGRLTQAKTQELLAKANDLWGCTHWYYGRQDEEGIVRLYTQHPDKPEGLVSLEMGKFLKLNDHTSYTWSTYIY